MTKRVAILISGSGSNMVTLAESMTGDHPARPCLVLSSRTDAAGLQKAEKRGIPTRIVASKDFKNNPEAFENEIISAIEDAGADMICLAGFMRVLSPRFVTRYAGRMLNTHPSLLPKYKGLNTHARAIAASDAEAGCSVHEVTAELDGGPVLGQARVPILPGDTPETLAARVLDQEHRLYPMVLRRFAAGNREPILLS